MTDPRRRRFGVLRQGFRYAGLRQQFRRQRGVLGAPDPVVPIEAHTQRIVAPVQRLDHAHQLLGLHRLRHAQQQGLVVVVQPRAAFGQKMLGI